MQRLLCPDREALRSASRTLASRMDQLSQTFKMSDDVEMNGGGAMSDPAKHVLSPSLDTLALTAAMFASAESLPVPATSTGPLRPRTVDVETPASGASVGDPRLGCLDNETMALLLDPSAGEELMPTVLTCACSTRIGADDEDNKARPFGINLGKISPASRQRADSHRAGSEREIAIAAIQSGADPISRGGVENNGNPVSERVSGWLARSEATTTASRVSTLPAAQQSSSAYKRLIGAGFLR